ncbi:DUF3376 domain-containing protein [Capsulimonas corticalis]|nr:DUF3376 domain-containing protein [Capsulimonas corticalis]
MVGGTSLAIYEHGVAQELFRMVHGLGMYGLLKRITQSHAYVDIVSGTSAGGINGVGLCTALTCGSELEPMRAVWVSGADIDNLLQDPKDGNVTSILKGESYYFPLVQRLFQQLSKTDSPGPYPTAYTVPSGWWETSKGAKPNVVYADLDLFVTGTYYEPLTKAYFDSRSKAVFNHDYAGVFQFKHRPRQNQSHFRYDYSDDHPLAARPTDTDAQSEAKAKARAGDSSTAAAESAPERRRGVADRLARVARTTSSLPALFEPSEVDPVLMGGIIETPAADRPVYMSDGGFLNNRPLNLVLKEVARRPASQEVLRKVVFVEPSPENRESGVAAGAKPNALQNTGFYFDVPHRQSLTECLATITEHNAKALKFKEVLSAARKTFAPNGSALNAPADKNLWVEICLQVLRDTIIGIWSRALKIEDTAMNSDDNIAISQSNQADVASKAPVQQLRVLRSRLYARLRANCLDYQAEVTEATSTSIGWEQGCFHIEFVDPTYIVRKSTRAFKEIYEAIFPQADFADILFSNTDNTPQNAAEQKPKTEQELRNQLLTHLSNDGDSRNEQYQLLQGILRQINHVRDLADIIANTLVGVLGGMVNVDEFTALVSQSDTDAKSSQGKTTQSETEQSNSDGATQTISAVDNNLDNLWKLLVNNIYYVLSLTNNENYSFDPAATPTQGSSNAEAGTMEYEARQIKKISEDNCRKLLNPKEKMSPPSGFTPEQSILALLEDRIDRLVSEAALILTPSITYYRNLLDSCEQASPCGAPVPKRPIALEWATKIVGNFKEIGKGLQALDIRLFPTQHASDLANLDRIELLYVTPRDCTLGASFETAKNKLAGDVLGNLGGFLKRSWRVNDIMWGRLDSSGAFADMLLQQTRLIRILDAGQAAGNQMFGAIDRYITTGRIDTGTSDPDAIGVLLGGYWTADVKAAVKQWLSSNYAKDRTGLVDSESRNLVRDMILRRHHLEILEREVPEALAEAISEAAQWRCNGDTRYEEIRESTHDNEAASSANQTPILSIAQEASTIIDQLQTLSTPTRSESNIEIMRRTASRMVQDLFTQPDTNNTMRGKVTDRHGVSANIPGLLKVRRVAAAAILMIVKKTSSPNEASPGEIERYFSNGYAIGREEIAINIPPLVSIRRIAAAILIVLNVLDNCLTQLPVSKSATDLCRKYVLAPFRIAAGALYGFLTVLGGGKRLEVAVHTVAWTIIFGGVALVLALPSANKAPVWIAIGIAGFCEAIISWATSNRKFVQSLCLPGAVALILWMLAEPTKNIEWRWSAAGLLLLISCLTAISALLPPRSVPAILQRAAVVLGIGALLTLGVTYFGHNALPAPWSVIPFLQHVNIWILAAAALTLSAIMAVIGAPLNTPVASAGVASLELAPSLDAAERIISSWPAKRRSIRFGASLATDWIYIAIYVSLLNDFVAYVQSLGPNPAIHTSILSIALSLLAWAPLIAGFLDAAPENLGMLYVYRQRSKSFRTRPKFDFMAPRIIRWSSLNKFALTFLVMLVAAGSLWFKWGNDIRRPSSKVANIVKLISRPNPSLY